jgi:hypothetical protein
MCFNYNELEMNVEFSRFPARVSVVLLGANGSATNQVPTNLINCPNSSYLGAKTDFSRRLAAPNWWTLFSDKNYRSQVGANS